MQKVWLLLDNRMGSVGQARGVAGALSGAEIIEKKIIYNCLAKLPNFFKDSSLLGISKQSKQDLQAPFPDVVISASRRTAPIARWIKKQSKNKTKIVQLMHPGKCGLKDFDLVFVSEHDRHKISSDNIVYIQGAPHRITKQKLAEAKERWAPKFAHLPQPLTAVIVGGTVKGSILSAQNAKRLGFEVKNLKDKTGGAVLLTTSHRTGEIAQNALLQELENIPAYSYLWGNKEENPYLGFLACADSIVVTGDSVSMCSEACGTGKPVYIFSGEKWLSSKHLRFVYSLFDGGFACALDDLNIISFTPQQILDSATEIAEKIKKL